MVTARQNGKSSEEQNEDVHCEKRIESEQGKRAYLLNREAKGKGGHNISKHSLAERVRFHYDTLIHVCVCVCVFVIFVPIYV